MDFLLIRKLLRQAWSPEQIVGHIQTLWPDGTTYPS
jgi:hypothetical protein